MQLGVYDSQRNYVHAPIWTTTKRWWQTGQTKGFLTPYDVEWNQGLGFTQFIPALAAGITSVVAAVAPLYLAREQRKLTLSQINNEAALKAQAAQEAAAQQAALAPYTGTPIELGPVQVRMQRPISQAEILTLAAGVGLLFLTSTRKRRR